DLAMPHLNGIDATRQIHSAHPDIKIIFLTALTGAHQADQAFLAGASGFVQKESAFEELAEAIETVVRGVQFVSRRARAPLAIGMNGSSAGPQSMSPAPLSNREREVIQLIAEGHSTKQIASELNISIKTVETHRRNLMGKLNVESVAELTRYAVRE